MEWSCLSSFIIIQDMVRRPVNGRPLSSVQYISLVCHFNAAFLIGSFSPHFCREDVHPSLIIQ